MNYKRGEKIHINEKDGINVTYKANQKGFRGRLWNKKTDKDDRRVILLLGDSNAFGQGVELDKRASNRLNSQLGEDTVVYNISVQGWGFDQMYLALKKYYNEVKPDIVIFQYFSGDLARSINPVHPLMKIENVHYRQLDECRVFQSPLAKKIIGMSSLLTYFDNQYLVYYKFKVINQCIIKDIVNTGKDTKFIFIRIPTLEEISSEDHMTKTKISIVKELFELGNILKENNITYVDPSKIMKTQQDLKNIKYHFLLDRHLNNEGHQVIADLLEKEIKKI